MPIQTPDFSPLAAFEATDFENKVRLLPELWRFVLLRCALLHRADYYSPEIFGALTLLGRKAEALELAALLEHPSAKVKALLQIALALSKQASPDIQNEALQLSAQAVEIMQTYIQNSLELWQTTDVLIDIGAIDLALELVEGLSEAQAPYLVEMSHKLITAEARDQAVNLLETIAARALEILQNTQVEAPPALDPTNWGREPHIRMAEAALRAIMQVWTQLDEPEKAQELATYIVNREGIVTNDFVVAALVLQQWDRAMLRVQTILNVSEKAKFLVQVARSLPPANHIQALDLLHEATNLARDEHHNRQKIQSLGLVALALQALGEDVQLARLLEEINTQAYDERAVQADILLELARQLTGQARGAALHYLSQAMTIIQDFDDSYHVEQGLNKLLQTLEVLIKADNQQPEADGGPVLALFADIIAQVRRRDISHTRFLIGTAEILNKVTSGYRAQALKLLASLIKIADKVKSNNERATIFGRLALVLAQAGESEQATQLLKTARIAATARYFSPYDEVKAEIWANLVTIMVSAGATDTATQIAEALQARAICGQTTYQLGEIKRKLAQIWSMVGQPECALEIANALPRPIRTTALAKVAYGLLLRGEGERAAQVWQASVQEKAYLRVDYEELAFLTQALLRGHRPAEARQLLTEFVASIIPSTSRIYKAEYLCLAAREWLALGDQTRTLELLSKAYQFARAEKDVIDADKSLTLVGIGLAQAGEWQRAQNDIAPTIKNKRLQAKVKSAVALQLTAIGQTAPALEILKQAEAEALVTDVADAQDNRLVRNGGTIVEIQQAQAMMWVAEGWLAAGQKDHALELLVQADGLVSTSTETAAFELKANIAALLLSVGETERAIGGLEQLIDATQPRVGGGRGICLYKLLFRALVSRCIAAPALLQVIEHLWSRATKLEIALALLPLANSLITVQPAIGPEFDRAWDWVVDFISTNC